MRTLRVLQCNTRACRSAFDLQVQEMIFDNIDLMIVSDPPFLLRRGVSVPGFDVIKHRIFSDECDNCLVALLIKADPVAPQDM